jgi:hypothetical protein
MADEYTLIESGDGDDAENVAAVLGHPSLVDTVHPEYQFQVTSANTGTANSIDMSGGKAFVGFHGTLQTTDNEDRREGLFVVEKTSESNIPLAQVDGENYLWVDAQIGTGDSPQWVMTQTESPPSTGSLLVADFVAEDTDNDGNVESIIHQAYHNRGSDLHAESITDAESGLEVLEGTTVSLVTDDFERASLGSDYVGDVSDAQIQSSVALEGSRSLKISRSSTGSSFVSYAGGDVPQFGDTFNLLFQQTDSEDVTELAVLASDLTLDPEDNTGLRILVKQNTDELELAEFVDGGNLGITEKSVDLSSIVNGVAKLSVELGLDRSVTVSLLDSTDTELVSVTTTVTDSLPESGAVQYKSANNTSAPTQYFDGPFITRRTTEETRERQRGSTETSKLQTRGGVGAGPPTATPNQRRRVMHRHPVTTDATAGQRYVDAHMVGGSPVAYLEGEFDGSGGTIYDYLQAGLGPLTKVNANLSWDVDTLADTPFWETTTTTGDTAEVIWPSGAVEIDVDGDSSGENLLFATTGVTQNRHGPWRAVFQNVDFTENGGLAQVGLSDGDPVSEFSGDQLLFRLDTDDANTRTDGTVDDEPIDVLSFPVTLAIEWDGSTARFFVDGTIVREVSYSRGSGNDTPLKPFILLQDGGSVNTLTVDEISIQPITEVLR